MKKNILRLTIFIILLCTVAGCFVACRGGKADDDAGIVITFVTGFENDSDPIIITPRVSTMKEPAEMPVDPWKAGYEFLGWYYDKEGTNKFSTADKLYGDVTLYAKWKKKRVHGESVDVTVEAPDGLKYYPKEDGTYEIVGYVGTATELILSPTYEGKRVTSIAENAFGGCGTLTSVTVASSINEIAEGAFRDCYKLARLVVVSANEVFSSADGVIYAGGKTELVAAGMGRTDALVLPDKTAKIRPYALEGGKYEVKPGKASAMTVVSEYAFAGFMGRAFLPASVKEIRRRAFFNATAEIVFPDECGVTELRMGEFDGYIGARLVLPGSVSAISGSPFYGMTAEVDISATGIKNLGESAFAGYAGRSLVIPYFVETTDRNCFYRCSSDITFDSRSTYSVVEEYAFNQFCGTVTFPTTVTEVKEYAFYAMRNGKAHFTTGADAIKIADKAFYLCDRKNVDYTLG